MLDQPEPLRLAQFAKLGECETLLLQRRPEFPFRCADFHETGKGVDATVPSAHFTLGCDAWIQKTPT